MQRPAYGWGTFGRNRVYSQTDGKDISTTDGLWIILMGSFGYVGFACFFALVLLPLGRFAVNGRSLQKSSQPLAASLAMMVALLMFDLLPNARSDFLSVVYAGILWTVSRSFVEQKTAVAQQIQVSRPSRASTRLRPAAPNAPRPT
jgi:hypothetical protein